LGIAVRASLRASAPVASSRPAHEGPPRAPYDGPSHMFVTQGRFPVIGLAVFTAQPPNQQPAPLMDVDFAIIGQLVRRRRPHIRFLSIGSRLCSTLPSDPASRRRPCASLSLLLHQDVKGTSTPKLSIMCGAPIGIGGGLTAPPLPHHRTSGSAYGGSIGWSRR
jgi:hypothetical protein